MHTVVQFKLTGLSELLIAAVILALVWSSTGMNVHVILQVLLQCKPFVAKITNVLFARIVDCLMAPHAVLVLVHFIALAVDTWIDLLSFGIEETLICLF